MQIQTKPDLTNAVNNKQSDITVSGKLARDLNLSMLSSQNSLFIRLPLILIVLFLLFVLSEPPVHFAFKLIFTLALIFIVVSFITDIFLASRIGYTTAKKLAANYEKLSFDKSKLNLTLKRRTDI